MRLFVALCTLATLSLVRASASEEYDDDVEDHDLNMDMELSPRDLEEYDGDDLDVELREEDESEGRRPPPRIHPYCVRTFHPGWGGQCLIPDALVHHSCDFIYNADEPSINPAVLCYNSTQKCCVDCYAPKQAENCRKVEGFSSPARRECCKGDIVLKHMNSGCNCCGKCKPSHEYCTRRGGFCVTRDDPVYNFAYCKANGGKLYYRRCEGKHCKCCIGAPDPRTY